MRKNIPTGSVFQKTYRDRRGKKRKTATYYLKYYVNGEAIEVSCGTSDYDEALATLRKKMAAASSSDYTEHPERVRVTQLLDLLIENYQFHGRKSAGDTKLRVNAHLRPFFGEMKAHALSTRARTEYVQHRRRQKAEAATINKELSWLRRAFRLGAKHDPPLVLRVPSFDMLPVDNVRDGTMSHEHYKAVRDSLPGYARIALVIAYHTGARKGEVRAIRRDKIDLKAKRINLPGRTTKNGKPRYLPIYGDMGAELDMWLTKLTDKNCPLLVQHDGRPVFDFEKVWATACSAAGISGTLFHDLRRTAVTNMIEAGLSEKEAMEISGHKTRAIFDRYHIISERRMKQNAEKLEAHLKAKESLETPVLGKDNGANRPGRVN